MTPLEAIRDIHRFNEVDTIYAARPWTLDSTVIVTPKPDEGGPPAQVTAMGLDPFLQVFEARDLLDGWAREVGGEPEVCAKVARLIGYAEANA